MRNSNHKTGKIITIPDKPDKFPNVRQDQGKGISYIHSEGDKSVDNVKTSLNSEKEPEPDIEPDDDLSVVRPIPATPIPYTHWT